MVIIFSNRLDMQQEIHIGSRTVGKDHPSFIIAEAGVNHNGDVKLAQTLIKVAAEAGVDAVKFQTFRAESLVTPEAQQAAYQSRNSGIQESQLAMLKRLELTYDHFRELQHHATEHGIIFLSSPFDLESIDFLNSIDVPAFKVGSGELTNLPYLRKMARYGKPMIVSTGMATLEEVQRAQLWITQAGNDQVIFLHCTSNYPCADEEVNLNAMHTLQNATKALVGYSDHTEGILVPQIAVAMGANVIEKHFTLDKHLPGPDHKASLEPDELKAMIEGIRRVEKWLGSAEKKPTPSEKATALAARKSIVARIDIPVGTQLTEDMLSVKRPGSGMSPAAWDQVIGKITRKPIAQHEILSWDQLES